MLPVIRPIFLILNSPQLLPTSISMILAEESSKPQKSAIETLKNYGSSIDSGESVTVTTTTTTVVQKKDSAIQPVSNSVKIPDYSPSNQRYYNYPQTGLGPTTYPSPLSP